ncbi:L-rhamnose catabolism isomerase [Adhaeribacter aerolatus]|uniref:L-rhamnose catabolism isomerase n=1 Tax=Adhaeribacter aerolatus TaxID=670289 RepID=A0A512B325_9BACT|nr:sugar isomerase [Adhaeribacter aerolatus]GEO06368.1 L-rhamnose catabolism isomerase [Adhaeribacter aerolatus]
MILDKSLLDQHNSQGNALHQKKYGLLASVLQDEGHNVNTILERLAAFQVAIPSWALGTGGTRFGRFAGGGEPRSLEEKIEDVGLLHALNQSSGAISLHIPWDIPQNPKAIQQLAASFELKFDAVNSNTFQDQENQDYSYKFGSLSHTDKAVRDQAIAHNVEVIRHGVELGSKSLTIWLSDGTDFPGQQNFRRSFARTLDSFEQIYAQLPADWKVFIEYKPYEPHFYSTVVADWGSSLLFCQKLGEKALGLVDLGHHLPNTNIEQIVSRFLMEGKLGGFHFNDSKYGDDDLTVGAMRPYQLFLIFNELVDGMTSSEIKNPELSWMIDASHNIKDPLEDLMQSVEAIMIAYAQALIINRPALEKAQLQNDATLAQEILQNAYRTDVRPLLAEARFKAGAALNPVGFYREQKIRKELIKQRGEKTYSTGL